MIDSKQQTQKAFGNLLDKSLPGAITSTQNIRYGTVNAINATAGTVDVTIRITGEIVTSLKYQQGTLPVIGADALVITPELSEKGRRFAITFSTQTSTETDYSKAMAYRSTGISYATGALVALNTTLYDQAKSFDTSNGVYTVPSTGHYSVLGAIGYVAPTSGQRYGFQIRAGSSVYVQPLVYATGTAALRMTGAVNIFNLTAGTTIGLVVSHSHGGALALNEGYENVFLSISKLA